MALSGTRLTGTLATDFLSQLQAAYPVNSSLLPAEKTAYATAQSALAQALANAAGPDIVGEFTGHAVVPVTVVSVSGVQTGSGVSGAGTGTGTVT